MTDQCLLHAAGAQHTSTLRPAQRSARCAKCPCDRIRSQFTNTAAPLQETLVNAPTMCARLTAPTLELLDPPGWADGATFCGSATPTLRSQPGAPPGSACGQFSLTVRATAAQQSVSPPAAAACVVAALDRAHRHAPLGSVCGLAPPSMSAVIAVAYLQFEVNSTASIVTDTTSAALGSASTTVFNVPCPLPTFGASGATLMLTQNWNW